MPYTKFLFSAIIGAIIGYITNWLAIKMLFRPHTEKRIFGMKVPFTPGLIPKEQDRIAKSTGEAVGKHLLTSETMVEALRNNGMDEKFKIWVENKVLNIVRSNISIGEQLKEVLGEKFDSFIGYIKLKITGFILRTIRKDKFKEEVESLILKEIKKELSKNPEIILENIYYKDIRNNLLKKAEEYKNSNEFKQILQNIIDGKISELENLDKTLEEVIPIGFISTIKVYVYSRNHDIAMAIKNIMKDDSVQEKIKKALSEMISSNVNSLVAMFLNPDTIFNKLSPAIEGYLDKEDNQKEIALFINDLIDKLLQNKLSDILLSLSDEGKEKNARALGNIIVDKVIDTKLINEIFTATENKLKNSGTIEELLKNNNIDAELMLKNFINDKLNYITENKEIECKIGEYVDTFVDDIMKIDLYNVSKGNEDKISKITSKLAEEIFERFLTNKAGEFIKAFDISKIVEDRINSFEVSFAEQIILEISSKELNAITWLGALLGFIMGLVSSVIATL